MQNNKGFEKFIKPEFKGAKKKEAIRQEKRRIKKEITEKRWKKLEDRRQMTDDRWKEQGERRQGVESGRHKTDSRRESTENRWQKKSSFNNRQSFGEGNNFRKREAKNENQDSNFSPRNRNSKYTPSNQKFSSGSFTQSSKSETRNFKSQISNSKPETRDAEMPLNKFIAYCGVCGRREAAELVKQGLVTVNGDIIFEPGFKVRGNEDVKLKGKRIFLQHNLVYILLNKPKDYLTTAKDPEGRKTVYDLIRNASDERVYSVGRLDRNTTGVLLLTNDGELAQKLTHPSFQVKKIYEVTLDRPLTKHDLEQVLNGITLDDGFVKADAAGFVDVKDKRVIGIEIHNGRNRIVRRIFEHLGYDVRNLDRVMFANLTKKNVERGKYRMLTEKEVRLLKHMNQSFVRKQKNEI